jgi:CubicO group peptidase (beta-lactamase class C family)
MTTGGFSAAGLAQMHEVLAGHVERSVAPGLVSLVSRGGESVIDTIGVTAVDGREAMQPDTIFRIASMTKPVAAVAAMILVEECVLRLDDPVDELLPELADRQVLRTLQSPVDDTVPANRPITLRDLLTFRQGIGFLFEPGDFPIMQAIAELGVIGFGAPGPAVDQSPDQFMRLLGEVPLMAQPGERWLYNTGSSILGVLIARASGQPLETFLRERIFAPLGMKDTGFSLPAEKLDRLPVMYWTDLESGVLAPFDTPDNSQWSQPPPFPDAAGGLVSTAGDYLAFARMLLDEGTFGGERILSRPSVTLMTTNHLTPAQITASGMEPGSFGWGFGMGVRTTGDIGGSVGSYGWDGGFGTSWANDPGEHLIGILLTQAAFTGPTPPAVVRDFWTSAYQALDD